MSNETTSNKANRYYSVDDVADIMGVSPEYVRRLIRDQRILAEKRGALWIDPKSFETFNKARLKEKARQERRRQRRDGSKDL